MSNIVSLYDFARMCSSYSQSCKNCPMNDMFSGEACVDKICFNTDTINDIVVNWCKSHPIETYKSDFFKKFPNAEKDYEGYPVICKCNVYGDRCEECKEFPKVKEECNRLCWDKQIIK